MNNKKSKDKKHKSRFKDIFKSKFLTSFTKNLKTNNKLNSLKELYSSISNKLDDLAGFNDNENYKNANNKDIIINKKNLNKKNFNNKNLNNRDFSNRDFNNRNLNNRDFSNRDFNNRNLNNRDFSNRDFNNKSFDKKNFDNRDFGKENLNKKNFNNKDFIKKNPNNRDFNKKNFNKKINNNNIDSLANGSTKEEEKHEKYLKEFDKKFNKQFHDDFDDDAFYMGNMSRFEEENNYNNPYNDMVEKDRSIKSKKQEKFKLKDLPKINKDSIKSFKKSIIKDDETKALFGAAIFGLIIIVLLFSSYYFLFYQPFIGELDAAKTNKMNELNSLFKGPLSLDDSVLTLKSEIELSNSPEEVKAIDILRPATYSWRTYQTKQIDNKKDEFNRIMISYDYENSIDGSKNIIINVSEAKMFVIQNDGIVLSNIEFQKPDTVAVPILITRLQAGAGLVSVGSIVDIYTLSNNNFQNQTITPQEGTNSSDFSEIDNSEGTDSGTISTNDSSSSTVNDFGNSNSNSQISKISKTPDISGVTVLSIIRSKDSGSIKADNKKSHTTINGNSTYQIEDSKSFSTNVEEMLRAAISGGYDESETTKLLDSYGLKLAEYERKSNLGELEVEYLLLIEVPKNDVPYVINNMDDLILAIPTGHAPNWMANELKQTYLNNVS